MPQGPDQGFDAEETIAGRYVVESLLGRGGMASVYRVRDRRSGRRLALKRAYACDPDKASKRRALLEREYHTLTQLSHPRIIEVYDYGVDGAGPYYTMELLDGADLDGGGQVPWRETCALLRDVASSLAILHSRALVHRDVSSRNVRRTADGRAKLLDFGAMICMGVAKEVIGTPPFMAPEVLQMQALDGRADLFALGALGYYLLTGRHAYPARRLTDLRDVWRSRPSPPERMVAELPPALGALILQLLSMDRTARPQSAAEVMERLCTIAGLPLEERIDVSRAYLTTPSLVGREQVLVAIRSRMLSLVRGDGVALLIAGPSGAGRSRMLDACAFEGKLLGAVVVRADAGDGASGDWGVARALLSQFLQMLPKESEAAARLSRDVLGHVIDALRIEESVTFSISQPERGLILRELRDFVLALAQTQRLVLVVDDADRIDEPSAAFLAALAHKSQRNSVMIALSIEDQAGGGSSLQLYRSLAHCVTLEPLSRDQTEALVRSLFGDVVNVQLCAGRIHAIAQGNPGASMELAQQLVRRGLARYQAGSWLLPAQLESGDLPPSLAASLVARMQALGPDARELAEAFCVCEGHALDPSGYGALTVHEDPTRVFHALDELVAARVLVADADRYRFSQRGFASVLHEITPPERWVALHLRMARLLARTGGDVVTRAHHLLHAGLGLEAVELLCSLDLVARLPPLSLLEQALEQARKHALAAGTIYRLCMAVTMKASLMMAGESFRRCVPTVLAQLEHDSGLALYRELDGMPAPERLAEALKRTQARYLATPERDRVYAIGDAIRELARLSAAFCSMAVATFDVDLLESLPSVEPLLPLSPALHVLSRLVQGATEGLCGRWRRAQELYEQVLTRLGQPDRAGLDEAQYNRTFLGQQLLLALFDAAIGSDAAEKRAQILENHREMRINAWRVRMILHFNQGNAEAARKCLRRAELLQLQDGGEARYLGSTAAFELYAFSYAGDLLGVKSSVDALDRLAQQHAGWRPVLLFGQSRYRELQGDMQGALDLALAGLELARPGRHSLFYYLACAHVRVLAALGRIDEALARGFEHLDACDREHLLQAKSLIEREFAVVLARAGEHQQAVAMIEPVVQWGESLGAVGLSLGMFYEARARVAMYMKDLPAFEAFAERCALEYKKGQNPVLSAKFAALLEDARQNGIEPSEPARELVALLGPGENETAHDTIRSRILECVDRNDRARCALTMLLQSTDACMGYLYGVHEHEVVLLSGLPELMTDESLSAWVMRQVMAEADAEAIGKATLSDDDRDQAKQDYADGRYHDHEGRTFEATLLIGEREQEQRIAAVLVVACSLGPRMAPPRYMLFEIASRLLEHSDVPGVALAAMIATQDR
jgi:hypothetical protein